MRKLFLGIAFVGVGVVASAQLPPMTPQQKAQVQARRAEAENKRAEMQKENEERRAEHLDQMKKDLGLNRSQLEQIKAIQDRNQAERKAEMQRNQDLRRQKMDVAKRRQQEMDNEMRRILTPEQYSKWEAKKAENIAKKREKMMEKHDKFMNKRRMKHHEKTEKEQRGYY